MHTIKGLFFDLDGTLVDTIEANVSAYMEACKKIGISITRKQLKDAFGERMDVFMTRLYPDISKEKMGQLRKYKAEFYPKYVHLNKPNTQLINFLRTLKQDHETALVTMAQKQNAETVISNAGISEIFDHIITGDQVVMAKPNPEAYLKALELSGLNPFEVLAFEDSVSGIQAAKAAGIQVLKIKIPKDNL